MWQKIRTWSLRKQISSWTNIFLSQISSKKSHKILIFFCLWNQIFLHRHSEWNCWSIYFVLFHLELIRVSIVSCLLILMGKRNDVKRIEGKKYNRIYFFWPAKTNVKNLVRINFLGKSDFSDTKKWHSNSVSVNKRDLTCFDLSINH